MNLTELNALFNDKQFQAVSLKNNKNALILAGAGSGKTHILTHRIAYLCEHQSILDHQILAVTFTNKAAAEMKERLQTLLNFPVGQMWIGTFHSLAFRMLQNHYRQLSIPINLQIIDSYDQLRIIKQIIKELELDEKVYVPQKIRHFINAQKDEGIRPDQVVVNKSFFVKNSLLIYQEYQHHCNQHNLLDFAEILLKNYELLANNSAIRTQYQQQFSHILIDEFQDCNTIQYEWIKQLNTNNTVFFVGDDDQSIYSWRGAKIEHIHQAQDDFSPMKLIRLEQNYRSTGHILNASNHLIKNNTGRMDKVLWTDSGDGEKIDIFQTQNDKQEIEQVVQRIQSYLDNNILGNECAILYRTNAQSRLIEERLIACNIPYEIYGGLRFFDREEIKDVINYLKLILNSDDDLAFERVINKPTRGIGQATIEKIQQLAKQNHQSFYQAGQQITNLSPRVKNAVYDFYQLIKKLSQDNTNQTLAEVLENIIKRTHLVEHYAKKNIEIGKNKQQNLDELVGGGLEFEKQFNTQDTQISLKQAFIDSALLDADKNNQTQTPSVQLMTVHSAKGLEFPYVFIVGLEEELFPSYQSLEADSNVLEERRLCYVAMTRAMKKLHLSFAKKRFIWGQEKAFRPSRFLSELPIQHLNVIKSAAINTGNYHQKQSSKITPIPVLTSDTDKYQSGDKVVHDKFGLGMVTNYEGKGDNKRVEVNFKNYGKKWLILAYAKIEKLH